MNKMLINFSLNVQMDIPESVTDDPYAFVEEPINQIFQQLHDSQRKLHPQLQFLMDLCAGKPNLVKVTHCYFSKESVEAVEEYE